MTAPDAQIQAREIALAIARKGDACECSFCIGAAQDAIALALLSERTRATETERERAAKLLRGTGRVLAKRLGGKSPPVGLLKALADAIKAGPSAASIRTEGTAK